LANRRSIKRKKRHITIEDIARYLDLSKATVSLALNNNPVVAEATRQRVREAADKFGYRPNYFGKRLSKGKSDMIGLYILGGTAEQCNWARPSSWMFYNPILKAVSSELSQHGYRFNLEVISVEQATEEQIISSVIQEGSLDGMLLVVQDDIDYGFLKVVEESRFPFVVLNLNVAESISSVTIDNELGARKVVEHLVELGHRRIAYISGPPQDSNANERKIGFLAAAYEAGLEVNPELIHYGNWERSSGWEIAKLLMELESPPTAIFCANDHMAIGAIQMLQTEGIRIPQDISIVGYDDTELGQVVVPHLTTVFQPLGLMGELGAKEVLRQLDEESPEPVHLSLEPEVVLRESTACITG